MIKTTFTAIIIINIIVSVSIIIIVMRQHDNCSYHEYHPLHHHHHWLQLRNRQFQYFCFFPPSITYPLMNFCPKWRQESLATTTWKGNRWGMKQCTFSIATRASCCDVGSDNWNQWNYWSYSGELYELHMLCCYIDNMIWHCGKVTNQKQVPVFGVILDQLRWHPGHQGHCV